MIAHFLRRSQIFLQARHYFLSACILLLGAAIGFLVVTQSQADMGFESILDESTMIEGSSAMFSQGPVQDAVAMGYPIQTLVETVGPQKRSTGTKAYDTILRSGLEKLLRDVQNRCQIGSASQTLDHIESYIGNNSNSLAILDAWCITQGLSTVYNYDDPLIATKLPLIRLLAVHHAGNANAITQAIRVLPLKSRFSDQSQWGSWTDSILYAEHYGLLDRVSGDELRPLYGFSKEELTSLFPEHETFSETVFLHEVIQARLELDDNTSLRNILLYHPTNQRILRTLIKKMQRTQTNDQDELLKMVLGGVAGDSLETEILKKTIVSVID